MNQTKVFNEFGTILRDAVNTKLLRKLNTLRDQVMDLLDEKEYDSVADILFRHNYEVRTVLKLNAVKKTRTKREIDPENQCLARIGLGAQCSRSRVGVGVGVGVGGDAGADEVFCKSHKQSRPYGRVDVYEQPETKMTKRRGRRSKNDKEYTIENLDVSKYVQAILLNINDEPYLMDQNNILYQFNGNNEIVGCVVDDQVEWY
jgi:hypothetical protein